MPAGGQFTIVNAPLREIVRVAYEVEDAQLVGAPAWTRTMNFDINARASRDITMLDTPGATPVAIQMLRALLEDRFGLRTHREERELSIYALRVARSDGRLGERLTRSQVDCAAVLSAAARATTPPPADAPLVCAARNRPGQISAGARPLSVLALILSSRVGRMVIDQTGLDGLFDFVVDFAPRRLGPPDPAAAPSDAPALETALTEQLGLKLEATRAPASVLVVDAIQEPVPD